MPGQDSYSDAGTAKLRSFTVDNGGRSEAVAVSSTSAESSPILAPQAIVTPTVDVFVRQGEDGSNDALDDGTDMALLANSTYRLTDITPGNTLAFIVVEATDTGFVFITPENGELG